MLSLAREHMYPGLFAISSMSARDPGAIPASRREALVTKSWMTNPRGGWHLFREGTEAASRRALSAR
jgi:hypothetical protein